MVNEINTLCPGLGFCCRHTLTPHLDCAAFTPVTKSSTLLFTCLIRFRTRTTTWSCERSIQLVTTGCFTLKKATGAGGVGWICGNRRWFVTNNSPKVVRQRHSITGTQPTHYRPCVEKPQALWRTRSCMWETTRCPSCAPNRCVIYHYLVLT